MQKRLIFLMIPIFCLIFSMAHAKSAEDVIMALKKVEAQVNGGVFYSEYGDHLRDAKSELDMFLKSKEAEEKPEVADSVSKVFQHYFTAGEVFFSIMEGRMNLCDTELSPLYDRYPEIKICMIKSKSGIRYMRTRDVLMMIWGKASRELKHAVSLLKI